MKLKFSWFFFTIKNNKYKTKQTNKTQKCRTDFFLPWARRDMRSEKYEIVSRLFLSWFSYFIIIVGGGDGDDVAVVVVIFYTSQY